jgi:SAM-dependent methyltransferase
MAGHLRSAAALRKGASLEAATGGVVRYHAPADAASTPLPSRSIDVVFSNSVLEHVPSDVVLSCFAEARRVLRPDGVMFRSVNCGDHYAYVDRSITQVHYLQFSDEEWEK